MPSETRRRVLTAAICLVGSLAGCLGDGEEPGDSTTPTPSLGTERPSADRTATESRPTETLGDRIPMETPDEHVDHHPEEGRRGEERVTVAPENPDTSGRHYVEPVARIWNYGPDRTIDVFVRGAESGVQLDRSFDLEADETLRIDFRGPDSYLLAVQAEEGEEYGTIVGRDLFFCNDSWTNVQVDAEGVATAATFQESMGCATPTPEE